MKLTVPAYVSPHAWFDDDHLDEGAWSAIDDPKSAEYARSHLRDVREPIERALKILGVHGKNVPAAADELKRWIHAQVRRLAG